MVDIVIPEHIRNQYVIADVDALLFTDYFKTQIPNAKVLVVGAHDEPTANMLAHIGLDVTGIDLRKYDSKLPPCNYKFIQADFCELSAEFKREHIGTFDIFVCLSAIEHFGMCAYREQRTHRFYDVIGMRTAYDMLKEGGTAYITIPQGSHYLEVFPHWRVYDVLSMYERLVQDFDVTWMHTATAASVMIDSRERKAMQGLMQVDAARYNGIPPSVSTILILQKVSRNRISPD